MGLIVRKLSKSFGTQIALREIDLTLSGGTIALLGANGSGKSTLLRILATLTKPDAGSIWFNHWSYAQHKRQLRTQIGYLPQELLLPEMLTPRKFLNHLAMLRGAEAAEILHDLPLTEVVDQPFRELTGGQHQLVGIAQALIGSPFLLLLDELSRGLDLSEAEQIFRVVRQHGKFVIFSTHIPDDIERMAAQTVIVLERGQMLFCGTVEAMRSAAAGCVYEIDVPVEHVPFITASMTVSRAVSNGTDMRLRVIGKPPQYQSEAVKPSLEDAYLLLKLRTASSS